MSSQSELLQVLHELGIDLETAEWQDLASCKKVDRAFITADHDIFYDLYEKSPKQAVQTDQICLNCPVTRQCFEFATENELTGVFGGFYLEKGQAKPERNKHKTRKLAEALTRKIFNDV